MEKYVEIGAIHIAIINAVPWCDVKKINSSYECLKKVLNYFKESSSKKVQEIEV